MHRWVLLLQETAKSSGTNMPADGTVAVYIRFISANSNIKDYATYMHIGHKNRTDNTVGRISMLNSTRDADMYSY